MINNFVEIIVKHNMSRLKLLLKLVQELYHCVCWKRHISKVLKSLSWLRKRYFLQFPEDISSENYIEVMYIVLSEFWWHDANSMFLILQKKLRNFSKRQDQAKISFANFYVRCVFMCRCHEKTFYLLRTKSNSRFDYSYQWQDVYIGVHSKLILIKE